MEGKYHILGITTEGKRNYWTGSGWSEVLTDSKIFTDLDDARDEWWKVTGKGKKLPEGFRRIIVPNYPEEKNSAKESDSESSPKTVSSIEQKKILSAIRKEKSLWDNFPDILSSYSKGLDFVVEMDNSNATYISSLDDSLWKLCDELNIGFDSEPNGEGFYGRTYTFYHYNNDDNSATEIAVKNPDVSANFDMKSLVEDFQKYLSNQNRYDNVWYSGKPDSFTVDVDGDWKHDHLYMDMLVEEFLNDRGLTLADVQSRTIEEDGSDWYKAERTYRIKVPKTGELTAGQIAKKINNDKKAEESIKGQASSNFSRKSVYESIIGRR